MAKTCKVMINQLQLGNFVRLPLAWKDHPFLFSNFQLKQQAQIELLKNLNLEFVFVDLERSKAPPLSAAEAAATQASPAGSTDVLKRDMEKDKRTRIEMQKKFRRDLQKTEQAFNRSVSIMRNLVGKLRNRPLNAVDDAKDLISNIADQLLDSNSLVLHLMPDDKQDEGFYYHSLNVAVLSMLVAKEFGWERSEIETLGMGALFHDIGKLKIPSNVLKKSTPLTRPEANFIRQHPLFGIEFLRLADTFPKAALALIANHHEFLDGSGFPRGLEEKDLSKLCQLIAVVNQYDTLCHPAPQTKAKTPYAALGYLYKHFKTKLNPSYVGSMIKMLGIYPPGSLVELSNGQFGMVMAVNLEQLLLPRVLVYDALVPKDQAAIIDLKEHELTIVRCLPPSALPKKIHQYLNPRERVSYYFGDNNPA
ncbi:HD-GYP domain-containing protein [Shewanella salipaludis]|uniref:HD-GYP domain-containing protein n=1 Tax=Shewanella salipaludis TaxID=2723052 RepID=A0A972FVW1_9GAMM|nr:HD-GYP domain-containing protein [Shewanella salipaludis]NMH63572.1 HD-GYP domain-containing protein [Shewanella salipaludis]